MLPPSALDVHPTEVGEVEGAKNIGTTKSHVAAELRELGEFDQPTDRPVALFSPQPYIPQENRLITIEDSFSRSVI